MKTRTIIATIAVALIAGVSIFAACTKEYNKEILPSEQNKDYIEYFNDGTTVVATRMINATDINFNFNYDDFVSLLEDSASTIAGYDVILEDMQIIDDSLRKENYQGVFKMSFYRPTLEEGASYYFAVDKTFEITGSPDEGYDTLVYYSTPNNTNNTVYVCDRGTCNGSCELHLLQPDGVIVGAYCSCSSNNSGSCEVVTAGWLHDLAVFIDRVANAIKDFFKK